ncbi:MAG: RNA 2',3'-cyclic phosphodiesterase [Rhodocyclales bacterium]|nr:RNA 2',3'-cyclic phosphodiesterase [Rhodocyclales bacterium]MBI5784869.1 RNA 2',3'-cyclic phosphodiesterase [Rhodocyclales bacterium]
MKRCFFALWPDAALAEALHALGKAVHADCGGRLMRRDTLHLTLAFLGDLPSDRVGEAMRVADAIAAEPFDLTLDRLGYWKHNRILWAGGVPHAGHSMSPRLTFLADALGAGLREAGFSLDARSFAAHVTLLRDARCAGKPLMPQPFAWQVRDFVLAESKPSREGARYEIVARWPLVPPQVLK